MATRRKSGRSSGVFHASSTATADEISDLIKLPDLDDETLLKTLRARCQKDNYFTFVGPVLISINPYKWLDIYTEDVMLSYNEQLLGDCEPHIFGTAEAAYRSMTRQRKPQAVVISGESGAGKTEAAKLIMKYIFQAAAVAKKVKTHSDTDTLTDRIMATSAVLEAFGNAKTVRNDNSSRFGKYTELQFDPLGQPAGAMIRHYLLEKTRIVQQAPGERSYHIFYQLLAGATAEQKKSMQLLEPEAYRYLSGGKCLKVDGVNDKKLFQETLDSLLKIGLEDTEVQQLFRTLSAIMLLGNMDFGEDKDGNALMPEASKDLVNQVASLLGVSSPEANLTSQLGETLLSRTITAGANRAGGRGSVMKVPNTPAQAGEARDSLAKSIYNRVFVWLIERMNAQIRGNPKDIDCSIGILDIYGFEIFEHNSLEQLCINFTNEKLQHGFIQMIFVTEQTIYKDEGIEWTDVAFKDNYPCVKLIEDRKTGILPMLDEACAVPNGDDKKWVLTLIQNHKGNAYFEVPRIGGDDKFVVKHYAGNVLYQSAGCVDKNRDFLQGMVDDLMQSSDHEFIRQLFTLQLTSATEASTAGAGKNSRAKNTVAYHFRSDLMDLMKLLESSNRHYVRAIKPNSQKKANVVDDQMVLEQLKYNGVQETIRVRKSGYPYRYNFEDFIQRYFILLEVGASRKYSPKDFTQRLVGKAGIEGGPEVWQAGKTLVFFKNDNAIAALETMRTVQLNERIVKCQAMWRKFIGRKHFLEMKASSVILQKNMRRFVCLVRYKRVRAALLSIQALTRGFLARLVCRRQRRWVVMCQSLTRRWIYRRAYRMLQQVRGESAVEIQRHIKGYIWRHRYRLFHKRWERLQANVRGFLARRKLHIMLRGFRRLQAVVRMRAVRAQYRRDRADIIKTQAEVRRRLERLHFLHTKRLLTRVAACVRRFQALVRFRIMMRGFIRLQGVVRMRIARAEYRRDYRNVVLSQAIARRMITRRRFLYVRACIVRMQKHVRGMQARARYLIMRTGFIALQALHRMHMARAQYRIDRRHVILCQNSVRRHICRRSYLALLGLRHVCASYIQASVRRYQAQEAFRALRQTTVLCQEVLRAHLAVKRYRKAIQPLRAYPLSCGAVYAAVSHERRRPLPLPMTYAGASRAEHMWHLEGQYRRYRQVTTHLKHFKEQGAAQLAEMKELEGMLATIQTDLTREKGKLEEAEKENKRLTSNLSNVEWRLDEQNVARDKAEALVNISPSMMTSKSTQEKQFDEVINPSEAMAALNFEDMSALESCAPVLAKASNSIASPRAFAGESVTPTVAATAPQGVKGALSRFEEKKPEAAPSSSPLRTVAEKKASPAVSEKPAAAAAVGTPSPTGVKGALSRFEEKKPEAAPSSSPLRTVAEKKASPAVSEKPAAAAAVGMPSPTGVKGALSRFEEKKPEAAPSSPLRTVAEKKASPAVSEKPAAAAAVGMPSPTGVKGALSRFEEKKPEAAPSSPLAQPSEIKKNRNMFEEQSKAEQKQPPAGASQISQLSKQFGGQKMPAPARKDNAAEDKSHGAAEEGKPTVGKLSNLKAMFGG
ncbi:hypothetical protein CYMTET_39922 [Cymbomonas tetramitiformis]|uniref:Myosin motor domain-containing protein n=1 Tax=Cymbomonas tetramitiformis TaxID=36881 RepID=A0AAE0CBD4_9CHLO|nr:hypothetical protein CYMTET_39922 [Cymbomonas tetramitiformis]